MIQALSYSEQPQELLGRVVEPLDAHHKRIAQRARHRSASIGASGQQLLDEERVPLAAREQPVDELTLRSPVEDVRERITHVRALQWLEVEPPHAGLTRNFGKQWPQWMAPVQLIR